MNFNFIKLNEQVEKLIKLNFRMVNLTANMVNVNKKSYIINYFVKCTLYIEN